MAGIGFELRRLFDKRGIVSKMRAYAYTSLVVTGPMLLGVAFIGSVQLMGTAFGLPVNDRNLLVCMTTYALLGSLILTGTISMPVTRYIADMLYQERNDLVLPSFEGSLMILLPIGFLACLAFQLQTGQGFTLVVLNLMLFCELIVVWMATSYLTAIKDYRSILIAYFLAIGTSFLVSWVAYRILGPTLEGFMLGVAFGYGVMIIYSVLLLYRYFPLPLRAIDSLIGHTLTGRKPTGTVCNMTEANVLERECFPAHCIEGERVEVEFEGKHYKTMPGYDEYLRHLYGDYMQLPPVDERVHHHFAAYWRDA